MSVKIPLWASVYANGFPAAGTARDECESLRKGPVLLFDGLIDGLIFSCFGTAAPSC